MTRFPRGLDARLFLALAVVCTSCSLRPPYVMLTIEDPNGYAAESETLAIGNDTDLQVVPRRDKPFPLTVTVTTKRAEEAPLRVEAHDEANGVRARGTAVVVFRSDGRPVATVRLGKPCDDDTTCNDGIYCNGREACIEGSCQAQAPPCGTSFACVVSECVELSTGGGECRLSVDHGVCSSPAGEPRYCDPTAGCVPGAPCKEASDCNDGLVCNGVERCVNFRCEGGTPPATDDGDPCTTDGCNDDRVLQGLASLFHVSDPQNDGNQCNLTSGGRGICRAAVAGCAPPECGDGIITSDNMEACDDGNENNGDGCDNGCQVEPGWSCAGQPTTCTSICGDQITVGNEECDDGSNDDPCDGCRNNCTLVPGLGCGDGYVCGSEACDLGAIENDGSYSGCDPDCTLASYCGDGAVDSADGETCDDGALVSLDGCSATCQEELGWSCNGAPSSCASVCGDYVVRGSEACDQGPAGNVCANCTASCTVIAGFGCGDGTVCGAEQCDLGSGNNTGVYGGCNPDCTKAPACGDGTVQGGFGEACDLGVLNSTSVGSPCSPSCQNQYWVSGILSGVSGHGSVTLQLGSNGASGAPLVLSADDLFTLPTPLANGDSYQVSVVSTTLSPAGLCQVTRGSGVIAASSVANLLVDCFAMRTQMVSGSLHNCVRLGGRMRCWGYNFGALGVGDEEDRGDEADEMGDAIPVVNLGTGRTAMSIAAGGSVSCAILDNGLLKCWGSNHVGQLGIGNTTRKGVSPADMGDNLPAVNLGSGRNAVSLGLSDQVSCARLDDGTAKCWGWNNVGQLGQGDAVDRGTQAAHMGDNLLPISLGTSRTVLQIAAGNYHTCALLDNGAVKCWGSAPYTGLGSSGDHGDGPGEMGDALPAVNLGTGKTALEIAVSSSHTCARLNDLTVKCWGFNSYGRLGLGDTMTRGASGTMGDNLPTVQLGAGRHAVQLALGSDHSCARLDNGEVKCWGRGDLGRLGFPTTNLGDEANEMGDNLPSVDLGPSRTAVHISAGSSHTCALLDDGHLKCWGYNFLGVLGLGDTSNRGDQVDDMGANLPGINTGW